MAANTSTIAGLLKQTFRKPFVEMVRNEVTLLKRFKTERGRGIKYQWKVQHGSNNSVGPYVEDADLINAGNQTVVDAEIPWAMNRVVVRVTGLARAASRGEGAFAEALAFEMKWALPNLKDELNTQMMSKVRRTKSVTVGGAPVTAPGIDSIGHIVDDGSIDPSLTTYAGLSRAATYWSPYILDNAGTVRPLSIALMQNVTAEMEKPERLADISAIMTSRTNFNQYGNLMQDQRRYVNSTTLDGGFEKLPFEGRDLLSVKGFPAGDMYFLDESEWLYAILLDFETDEKQVEQDAERFVIKTYSQLICRAPARQARIADLPTA